MVSYKDAGVDIDAGNEAVKRMKTFVKETFNNNVITDLGSFGGMFRFDKDQWNEPILVSSTDGVGTKLKLAFQSDIHNTVGQDLVNHCVNDILVQGAQPLFFLDYIGSGKLKPTVIENIVRGFSKACKENGCALIGGETAEMPGLYKENEYDLAGCIVGVVDKSKVITGEHVTPGNIMIGLTSTGLHTNGYSLAQKVLFEIAGFTFDDQPEPLQNPVGKELMNVHKSYLKPVSTLMNTITIKAMAHITGGGILENIPRVLPEKCKAKITINWKIPPIFHVIQKYGNVETEEMFRTFNMGIGFVIIIDKHDQEKALEILKQNGEDPLIIGEIVEGAKKVELEHGMG